VNNSPPQLGISVIGKPSWHTLRGTDTSSAVAAPVGYLYPFALVRRTASTSQQLYWLFLKALGSYYAHSSTISRNAISTDVLQPPSPPPPPLNVAAACSPPRRVLASLPGRLRGLRLFAKWGSADQDLKSRCSSGVTEVVTKNFEVNALLGYRQVGERPN
jgi:hypothetical protein